MPGVIFHLRGDDDPVPMTEAAYDAESVLQELIARFPELLAGAETGEMGAPRWLLVEREAALPDDWDAAGRWSVDHLFLDQEAVPTLVEVKRSSDTRIRREVVGQILDYAANAVMYWPMGSLRSMFERRCQQAELDPALELAGVLGDRDHDSFWEQAGANLKAGRIRLVFVADSIPPELRRVVEFLNEQMSAEVVAIEVAQYVGDGAKTLVPRIIGRTSASRTRAARNTGSWDEASFLAALDARRGPDEGRVARELIAWCRIHLPRITWGKGAVEGSFIPNLDHAGHAFFPIVLTTHGRLEFQFQYMNAPPFNAPERRMELLSRINRTDGVNLPAQSITRRPSLPLSQLAAKPEATRQIIEALEWFCQTAMEATAD